MRVIALGGQPCTGKSTVMNSFIESVSDSWERIEPQKLVVGERHKNLFVIGKYFNLKEEHKMFPGTDLTSMAVMPEFKKYVEQNKDKNEVVIFEGDRLVSHNLLTWLSDTIGEENLFIIMLDVPQSVVNQRHIDRNDTQTEQFIKSRQTKYETIESDFFLSDRIKKMKHVDEDDTLAVVSYMHNVIDGDI